jgi:hypothetical protein
LNIRLAALAALLLAPVLAMAEHARDSLLLTVR